MTQTHASESGAPPKGVDCSNCKKQGEYIFTLEMSLESRKDEILALRKELEEMTRERARENGLKLAEQTEVARLNLLLDSKSKENEELLDKNYNLQSRIQTLETPAMFYQNALDRAKSGSDMTVREWFNVQKAIERLKSIDTNNQNTLSIKGRIEDVLRLLEFRNIENSSSGKGEESE